LLKWPALPRGTRRRLCLDCVGGESAGDVVRCLGLDGRLVIYGTLANTPMQIRVAT
jgi:NADPH:quinone reductase-like Zn-dependent oxidoreductase